MAPGYCSLSSVWWWPLERRRTEETELFLLIGRWSATRFCAVCAGVGTPRGRGSRRVLEPLLLALGWVTVVSPFVSGSRAAFPRPWIQTCGH